MHEKRLWFFPAWSNCGKRCSIVFTNDHLLLCSSWCTIKWKEVGENNWENIWLLQCFMQQNWTKIWHKTAFTGTYHSILSKLVTPVMLTLKVSYDSRLHLTTHIAFIELLLSLTLSMSVCLYCLLTLQWNIHAVPA